MLIKFIHMQYRFILWFSGTYDQTIKRRATMQNRGKTEAQRDAIIPWYVSSLPLYS